MPKPEESLEMKQVFEDLVSRSMALELAVMKDLISREKLMELIKEVNEFSKNFPSIPEAWDAFRKALKGGKKSLKKLFKE